MAEQLTASIYDHPAWYDLIFGSDWEAEYQFLLDVSQQFTRRKIARVFEPACGTGRLLIRLAAAGYGVSGIDLNTRVVAYCNGRLARRGFPPAARVADMTDFRLRPRADLAFNLINSFRHLTTEAAAYAHLRCMAAAVAPGGLYLLGLHLTPTRGKPMDEETCRAQKGRTSAVCHLATVERDASRRLERLEMTLDVTTATRKVRLNDELIFRMYTAEQMRRLLSSVPEWEIAETFDFHHRVEEPIVIGPRTEDVIYVLRRK